MFEDKLGSLNDKISFNACGDGILHIWYKKLPEVQASGLLKELPVEGQYDMVEGIERCQRNLDRRLNKIKRFLNK